MNNKKIITLLFIISLASGVFWNQKIFGHSISSDQVIYDGIAMDILTNGTYTYEGQETASEPVYPLFLAGIYKIFGHNYDAVRFIQILLFALTVCVTYILAEPLIGIKKAFIVGLLTSTYYPLVNQAGLLLQEILFTFLVITLAYSFYGAHGHKFKWWFLSGTILGLATLTKGSIQLFFLFVLGYILYVYHRVISIDKICFRAIIFMLGFFVIVGPWLVGNSFVSGSVGVTPRAGGTLLALTEVTESMSQNYTGNFVGFLFGYYFAQRIYPDIDPTAFRSMPKTEQRIKDLTAEGKSLREADSIMLSEAEEYLINNLQKYAYMAILNFINLNSPILIKGPLWQNVTAIHPMFADGRHPEMSEFKKAGFALGVRLVWFALFSFVIYGIWINRKELDKFGWILLVIMYFNLFYSLVWTVPRYALPMYPLYFLFAVIGIFDLWNKHKYRFIRLSFVAKS